MSDETKQILQSLADRNDGILTAAMVLEAAKPRTSPLHDKFTWNDKEAGEAYRLDQARALIRSVRVDVRVDRVIVEAPYFIRDSTLGSQPGYRSIGRLRTDEEAAREATITEMKRASGALARARTIAAVLEMTDEITAIEQQLALVIGRATSAGSSRAAT